MLCASILDTVLLQVTCLLAMMQSRFGFVHHETIGRNILLSPMVNQNAVFRGKALSQYRRWVFVVAQDEHRFDRCDMSDKNQVQKALAEIPRGAARIIAQESPLIVAKLSDFEIACLYHIQTLDQCRAIIPEYMNEASLQRDGILGHSCFSEKCYDLHTLFINIYNCSQRLGCQEFCHLNALWKDIWNPGIRIKRPQLTHMTTSRASTPHVIVNPLTPRQFLLNPKVYEAWEIDITGIDLETDLILFI